MSWDPGQYLRYSDQRALPFRHLVASVAHLEAETIVDLGCGPGGLTATLLDRWPDARITGIDTSSEMISHAVRRQLPGRLEFEIGDATTWRSPHPVDLMVSNACFHWIEDHVALLDHLLPQLASGGTLAFQVPANHEAPSHTILRDICAGARWRDRLGGLPKTGVRNPGWYVDEFRGRGMSASVWQTTYHHELAGDNPVLEWVKGTTLTPILERISGSEKNRFLAEYGERLMLSYPSDEGVTIFPFTRTFVLAARR